MNFRRITTQKRFIPQIDGLRFVAIASVVFFHIYSVLEDHCAIHAPIPLNIDLPKRGVELFFAISGFILGVPFASHYLLKAPKVKLRQYFLRRLTRLEPPYFLAFAVWIAAQWISSRRPREWCRMVARSRSPVLHTLVPILSLVFAIADARRRRSVILVAMAVIGYLSIPLYRTVPFHYFLGYYLAFFLAGFLVCDLYVTRGEWKRWFAWNALALCLWPVVWYPSRHALHVILPFVIVVLYLAAFRGRICSAIFSYPLITQIGEMC